jgi:hypothetical protein
VLAEDNLDDNSRPAVSRRRIAITKAVGIATDRLRDNYQLVIDSFIHTGIAISPLGHDDHLISIKNHQGLVNFDGWQTAPDALQALEIKQEETDFTFDDDTIVHESDVDRMAAISRHYRGCTVAQLKQLCKSQRITKVSLCRKEELVARLVAYYVQGSREDPIEVAEIDNIVDN